MLSLFLDFHDSIVENHRYTIPSWVNTCELVRQVFMHINYHTSSQFSSVKVMTRFLPLDLSFMNSSISSSSSAAVFFVAVTVLSAMLGTRERSLTGAYLIKEQPRSTRKGDSFLVLLLPLQQLRLIGIGNLLFYVMRNGSTRENQNGAHVILSSCFRWSLYSVSNLF